MIDSHEDRFVSSYDVLLTLTEVEKNILLGRFGIPGGADDGDLPATRLLPSTDDENGGGSSGAPVVPNSVAHSEQRAKFAEGKLCV